MDNQERVPWAEAVVNPHHFDHPQIKMMMSEITRRLQKDIKNLKPRIPSFLGNIDPDAYLEWEEEMELMFSCHHYTEEKKVNLATSGFSGYAIQWWEWIAYTRRHNGEPQITSWFEMKIVMRGMFAPYYNQVEHMHVSPRQKRFQGSRSEMDIRPFNEPYKPHQEESSHNSTCSRNFTQQGVTEKKNWSKSLPYEEVIQLSSQRISNDSKGDQRLCFGRFQLNQGELSNQLTCFRNLTHQGVTENKNRFKSSPYEEDIQPTSRQPSNEPEREQRLPIEEFQPNHEEPQCKLTCFGNLIHQRFTGNWIHFKIPYGLGVIQLSNQEILGLPYLEAHGFNSLQTRLWRPGEAYDHSGSIFNHQGSSSVILDGSDLRTNPFKGGGNGVILLSLNFKDLKIKHESNNHDHSPQSISYDGHFGRAITHLVHAESRDDRNSLLPDRSELVRPPEQLHEVILVCNDVRLVSTHSQTRDKVQEAQEDIKDELGIFRDEPKKMWAEQNPYWPKKLKDRPPWASTCVLLVAQLKNKYKNKPACWFNYFGLLIKFI